MTKIIAKNVEHRYSPRVPNRTEPREFDRYSIYIANNHCKVDLWSVYKKGEEILHTILGDVEFAFPEALKFIPDNRVKDFTNDFSKMSIENVVRINKARGLISDARSKLKIPTNKKQKSDFVVNYSKDKKVNIEVKSSLFDYKSPSTILAERVRNSGLKIEEIAERVGIHYSMVQKQIRGERDITRDHAIKYSKVFGCDPADLLFAPPQIPIWAYVNFLKQDDADLPFNAGELVPAKSFAGKKEPDLVTVPRDIYRPDVKAVQVKSDGSALDGMVLFYYATNDVKQDCIGRLSIIGDDEDDDIELFRYGQSQRYFIGILENFRGKTRLLNPDIYSRETLKGTQQDGEIVIQNVRPTFAAPIVAIVNPQQIKKDKYAEQLFRINEEAYRGQRLLEKAKLAWTERATAEMNKLKSEQDRLQKKLENIYKEMESEQKKGRAFFFGKPANNEKGIASLLDSMQAVEKIKLEQELAIQKILNEKKRA